MPLPPDLVVALRSHLEGKAAGRAAFPMKDLGHFNLVLKADVKASGVPYQTDAGEVFDFHALRHTFITHLDQAEVGASTLQALARHSSIKVTERYMKSPELRRKANGVAALPSLTKKPEV